MKPTSRGVQQRAILGAERWLVTNGIVSLNDNTLQVDYVADSPLAWRLSRHDLLPQHQNPTVDWECPHYAHNPDGEWRRQTKS